MKKTEFVNAALEGKPVVLVEYRSFKIENITYRDKKTQQTISRDIVKHAVEMGDSQVSVSEWVPAGVDAKTIKPPFNKGQRVVLELRGMERQQGFYVAEGNLWPFDDKA